MGSERELVVCMARLERQVRRLRLCLVALAVLCATVFLAGAAVSPHSLKLRELYILDEQGQMGVKIHAPGGLGAMSFWDTNMKKSIPQISIGCIAAGEGGGTQVFMKNARGERAVNIVAQEKGNIHTW